MKLPDFLMRAVMALTLITTSTYLNTVYAAEPTLTGHAQAGHEKNSMCIGCHAIAGYKATFPELYQVPMIAGQHAPYIEAALRAYKQGARTHPSMEAIATSLSDQDIADLAAYYSQLK